MSLAGEIGHIWPTKLRALLVVFLLFLVSCSSATNPTPATGTEPTSEIAATNQPPPTEADVAVALTLKPGILSVCTNDGTQPFNYKDDDGQWVGFDVGLLKEIANRNNLKLELTNHEFADIWVRPGRGECDVTSAALTITDERQKVALFSDPYFNANQSLAIRDEDIGDITSFDDLRGRSIGVLEGSTGQAFARSTTREAAIKAFPDVAAVYEAIENDDVDAVLIGQPTNTSKEKTLPIETVAVFFTSEQYGMAVSRGNGQLVGLINTTLAELRADGTYGQVEEEWI